MKTSAVLASALLSAFAVAAPVDKRALVYHTEVLTETVVVYTTVYDDDYVPEATTTPEGAFYEQPETTTSTVVVPTSSAVVTPSKAPETSSAYVPAPAPETSTPAPTPTPAPTSEQASEQPQPTTSAYVAPPAPVVSSAAPVASETAPAPQPSAPSTGTGESYSNVDITVYDAAGNLGACGTPLQDTDMVAAIAADAWGASTYDVMTGASTNKWCGQKIVVEYNGNKVPVTIMDLCPGCKGHDIDLTRSAWKQLTGSDEATRYQASWSMA